MSELTDEQKSKMAKLLKTDKDIWDDGPKGDMLKGAEHPMPGR